MPELHREEDRTRSQVHLQVQSLLSHNKTDVYKRLNKRWNHQYPIIKACVSASIKLQLTIHRRGGKCPVRLMG